MLLLAAYLKNGGNRPAFAATPSFSQTLLQHQLAPPPRPEIKEGSQLWPSKDLQIDFGDIFEGIERFMEDPPSNQNKQNRFDDLANFTQYCIDNGVEPPSGISSLEHLAARGGSRRPTGRRCAVSPRMVR